jgi:hypothetical protein
MPFWICSTQRFQDNQGTVWSAAGSGGVGSLLLRAKVAAAAYSDLAFRLKSHHPVKVVELLHIMASPTVVPS